MLTAIYVTSGQIKQIEATLKLEQSTLDHLALHHGEGQKDPSQWLFNFGSMHLEECCHGQQRDSLTQEVVVFIDRVVSETLKGEIKAATLLTFTRRSLWKGLLKENKLALLEFKSFLDVFTSYLGPVRRY